MLSEFENNLIAETPIIMDRKGRRWSLARGRSQSGGTHAIIEENQEEEEESSIPVSHIEKHDCCNRDRFITVIDEVAVEVS